MTAPKPDASDEAENRPGTARRIVNAALNWYANECSPKALPELELAVEAYMENRRATRLSKPQKKITPPVEIDPPRLTRAQLERVGHLLKFEHILDI